MKRESVERTTVHLGYLWLAIVGISVAAMSWTGLVGFAEDNLGITGRTVALVPLSLDGAAITCAFFGLRAVLNGDSAIFPRVLAWIVVGAGAAANYYHAWSQDAGEAAALYFAGMTLLVYLLFEVVLRQLRRRDLRAKGAIENPLPRFRFARWLRFPRLTFRAWSAAVRYGLTDPAAALERVEVGIEVDPAKTFQQSKAFIDALEVTRPPERPELQVTERTTVERQVTARNGTKAARIAELADDGLDLDAIVERTGFPRDTVRVTLRRIEQRGGS